jgi:DNA-directed RNA polymerase subunit D
MELKVAEHSESSMRFELEGTDPVLANALRRTLVADVPKMAIEDVEFHLGPIRGEDGREFESVTPLFDEMVAHRLGLIPIPTDLDLYNPRPTCPSCDGEGCPNCTIIYSINKRGPAMVTSSDLEPIGDPKLKPSEPPIPIVQLGDGQAMLVYATAILGSGREHAKWQGTTAIGYRYHPVVTVDNKKMEPQKFPVDICPVDILKEQDGKIVVEGEEKCTLCNSCVEVADAQDWRGAFKVRGDPGRILFTFETDGAISAARTLDAALGILDQRFAELAERVEALE